MDSKQSNPLNHPGSFRLIGRLYMKIRRRGSAEWRDEGLVSEQCVTNDFCELLVDTLQEISGASLANFCYHDFGTGTDPEDPTDSGLQIPLGESREVGTQVEGATTLIYKSVATHVFTTSGTSAITEHGIFNAAASGTLLDRSVFAARNMDLGDSMQVTYTLECVAGG